MQHEEPPLDLMEILEQVAEGTLSPEEAERLIRQETSPVRQPPPPPLSVTLIFLGLGILFFLVGAGIGVWSWTFASGLSEADGTVVKMVRNVHGGNRSGGSPVVRYQVADDVFEFQGSISSSPPAYSVGDKVTVLYRPEQPEKGQIKSFTEQWFLPTVFGGFGTLFTAIGIHLLWARARAKSADSILEPPLAEEGNSWPPAAAG